MPETPAHSSNTLVTMPASRCDWRAQCCDRNCPLQDGRGLVERSLELFPIFQVSQYQSFVLLAPIQEAFPFRPGAR